jgi:hypothetical protein
MLALFRTLRISTMPTRCSPSRSASPSAKRIKLANGQAGISAAVETAQATDAPTLSTTTTTTDAAYPAPDAALRALVEEEMQKPIEVLKTYERELDYENKLVLAPMVRTGSCEFFASSNLLTCTDPLSQCLWFVLITFLIRIHLTILPQRLLSLHYGAGLVWGPEIVDKAIIGAERIVDRKPSFARPRETHLRFTNS